MLIVAIDDADKALEIVRLARATFPQLIIFARARNRRHAYELQRTGANLFRRETFDSSLWMAKEALKVLGFDADEARIKTKWFMRHDEESLKASFEFFEKEPELIAFTKQAGNELERILQNDVVKNEPHHKKTE